jgi:adenylate kinase
MNVLLIGPPGSGKGTQGERLAAQLGLVHISSGDLLRAEVQAGTTIGRKVSALMQAGDLVPDIVIMALLLRPVVEAA